MLQEYIFNEEIHHKEWHNPAWKILYDHPREGQITVQLTSKFTIAIVFSHGTRTKLAIFAQLHKLCTCS